MREVLHLPAAAARRVPWRNGRGVTTELAVWPEGTAFERGDFDWRISTAAVVEPGPFSTFPGFERVLVVTSGELLALDHGEHAPPARIRRFEPHRFSGDWATSASLPSGPVTDFNVVVRRGRHDARVEVLRLGQRRARDAVAAEHGFVHVLSGRADARVTGEDDAFALAAADSLWVRGTDRGDELEVAGSSDDCVVVVVRIVTLR